MLLHYLPWAFSDIVTMTFPCVFGLILFSFSPLQTQEPLAGLCTDAGGFLGEGRMGLHTQLFT